VLEDHLIPFLPLCDAVCLGIACKALLATVRKGVTDLGKIRLIDAATAMRFFPHACSLHLVWNTAARHRRARIALPCPLPEGFYDPYDWAGDWAGEFTYLGEERLNAMGDALSEHAARIKKMDVGENREGRNAVARVLWRGTLRLESLSYYGGTPIPRRVLSTLRSLTLRRFTLRGTDLKCCVRFERRLAWRSWIFTLRLRRKSKICGMYVPSGRLGRRTSWANAALHPRQPRLAETDALQGRDERVGRGEGPGADDGRQSRAPPPPYLRR
jgi:hypothetical protein